MQEASQALMLLASRRKALDATFRDTARGQGAVPAPLWQDPRGGAAAVQRPASATDSEDTASEAGSAAPSTPSSPQACAEPSAAPLHAMAPPRQRARARRKGIRMEAKRRWSRRVGATLTT